MKTAKYYSGIAAITRFGTSIPDYIRKNALIYERYKGIDLSAHEETVKRFRFEVAKAFQTLNNILPNGVEYCADQPYQNVDQLTSDIRKRGVMLISYENNDSELLPGELNLQFRAIHDYLHYVLQAPFTAAGEIEVYNLQSRLHYSPETKAFLFSEVVLQACYCEYFGKFADVQKVVVL
jgi:hypothetical protein